MFPELNPWWAQCFPCCTQARLEQNTSSVFELVPMERAEKLCSNSFPGNSFVLAGMEKKKKKKKKQFYLYIAAAWICVIWPAECIQTHQSSAWRQTGTLWTRPTTASGLWTLAAVQRTAGIPSQESWCLLKEKNKKKLIFLHFKRSYWLRLASFNCSNSL